MAKTLNPTAKKQPLSLETVAGLSNGQALATINAAIRSAVSDIEDRGSDKKARKVSIELEFKKVGDGITATVKAKTSLPPYQTEPTYGEIVLNGGTAQMQFNPHCAENPNQGTLTDEDE